jgi:hypothetical protein
VTRTHAEDRGARASVLPRREPTAFRRTLEGGGPEAILALQRTAGNHRVARAVTVELRHAPAPPPAGPALERATPENRGMAEEIDSVERLPDPVIVQRRTQATQRAAATTGPEHEQAQRALEALEYVASTRRLPPPQLDWKQYDYIKHDPAKRRVYVRGEVEARVRDGGSFEAALEGFPDAKQVQDDLEPIRADAKQFAADFTGQARINADRMLDGSLTAIAHVLHSYGLPLDAASVAAERILKGSSTEEEAANVVRRAKQTADDPGGANAPGAAQHRMRLAEWVEALRHQQQRVKDAVKRSNLADIDVPTSVEGPAVQKALGERAKLREERTHLGALWIQAERLHPILAAYRSGTTPLEKIELGALDTADVDGEMKLLLELALPKVANIAKAHQMIKSGRVSPLALPSVVALTRSSMFVPDGSIRAGVINDLVKEQRKGRESWLLIAASIALALVTLVPSAGASLAVPAGMASVAMGAYSALKELNHYEEQKALYDTDLDRARALSDEEPSLTGFAVALVGIGFDALSLALAFRTAVKLRRLAMAGEQEGPRVKRLVDELNKAGKPKGRPDLGDQALNDARAAGGGRDKPPPDWDNDITEDIPVQKHATTLSTGLAKINAFASHEEVRFAVAQALAKDLKFGMSNAMLPEEWPLVIKALQATPGVHNAKILEVLPSVMACLRDPELYAEVMADAWQIAKNAGTDINAALKEMATAGKLPVRTIPRDTGIMKSKEFFETVATKPEHWVDEPLFFDDHGEMTHLIQDLVVDRGLKRAGVNMRSTDFRELLGKAEGQVMEAEGYATKLNTTFRHNAKEFETDMRTGDYVWRFTYDILQNGHINKPEELGIRLKVLLGAH